MHCIRLTQLLEEPPKETLQEVVFDEDMVNEYAAVPTTGSTANLWTNLRQITNDDNSDEQPSSPSESDQSTTNTNKTAKPVSPASREQEEGGEASTSSSTEESNDDKSSTTSTNLVSLMDEGFEDNTPESSSNSPERGDVEDKKPLEGVGQFPLSRKRSSSMRDSMESSEGSHLGGGGGESEEDLRGTVLQEADSTTLGGEHDENGRDEGMEGGAEAGEGGGSEEEEDLEQSTPKKRRSKSPEIETKSSTLDEGGRIDCSNTVDGKEAVTDTMVGGNVEKIESQDVLESESSLNLKKKLQPGSVEAGEGGREREEEVAAIAELHSSSSCGDEQEMRETSTRQLERSHDSKTDSKH